MVFVQEVDVTLRVLDLRRRRVGGERAALNAQADQVAAVRFNT